MAVSTPYKAPQASCPEDCSKCRSRFCSGVRFSCFAGSMTSLAPLTCHGSYVGTLLRSIRSRPVQYRSSP